MYVQEVQPPGKYNRRNDHTTHVESNGRPGHRPGPEYSSRIISTRDVVRRICPKRNVRLLLDTKQAVQVEIVVFLHVCLGYLRVRVWFGVVPYLAVSFLLGTTYLDSFIRDIFPHELKVLPFYSRLVSILTDVTETE